MSSSGDGVDCMLRLIYTARRNASAVNGCSKSPSMLSDSRHPRFMQLNVTIPIDVIWVKPDLGGFFYFFSRVPIRVLFNTLNIIPVQLVPGLVTSLYHHYSLSLSSLFFLSKAIKRLISLLFPRG